MQKKLFRRLSSLLGTVGFPITKLSDWQLQILFQVSSEMGNKPSASEGEDEEDRQTLKSAKSLGAELTNGGGEDADEEVELPPPMKPIQEPIVVTSTPPGVPDIEENPCKRVSVLLFWSVQIIICAH